MLERSKMSRLLDTEVLSIAIANEALRMEPLRINEHQRWKVVAGEQDKQTARLVVEEIFEELDSYVLPPSSSKCCDKVLDLDDEGYEALKQSFLHRKEEVNDEGYTKTITKEA